MSLSIAAERSLGAEVINITDKPIVDIPRISEIQHPDGNAQWLTQAAIIEITQIRLNSTDKGLEVILETKDGNKLQVTNTSEGNNFIVEIKNAQLKLASGNSFSQEKPNSEIDEIAVINQDANTIRLTVKGETNLPKVELFDGDEGLVFGISPTQASTSKPPTENQEPIELTVTGEEDSYQVPDATTATRTNTPLRDIPQSIQVIPRQVIEDRQVVRLSELADNVSGVQPERGYGGVSSQGYRIRGFLTNFETLRNGFPDYGYFSPRDVANVERVEFLKGPAAVLYGGSPTQYAGGSGLVNTVTKKPLSTPYYNANLTYGSYNFIRPTLDITGPLTEDKSLLYRLNVAYENADSFRDFVRNDSFFISPVVEWKVGEKTKVTFEFEHQKYNLAFESGFPIKPESLKLPRSRFLGEPNFANGNFTFNSFTYTLDSEFSKNWSFRQGFNVLGAKLDNGKYSYYGSLEEDGRTLNRFLSASDEEHANITFQNQISGKFSTGSIRHNVLFGVDLGYNLFNYIFAPDLESPIDIFNPQYGRIPNAIDGGEPFGRKIVSQNVGVFAQNLVELTPNLKVLLGGRFDFNEYSREDRVTNEVLDEQSDTRFSPRVGLVYQPTKTTSLYFNWTNGFSPQFQARSRTNQIFDPQKTEQFEVGVKQNLFNDKLSATLALFQITKQNVLTSDPVDSRFSIQTGEQQSKGIELDIAGEILPGWKVIANYAYIDGTVTKDNVIPVGDRLFGVPENSFGLWTTYEFQKGSLRGLGVGVGLYYVGEQEVILPNSFQVPSYLRADASIFYRRDNYKYALNFKNISSVKYYELDGYNIDPAPPFTMYGTVSFEF
ncbi:MAG: TonB-dependent siderophore receptor [Methylacidiphilales bacterium]|nr:TonB-dependent siderophore receptor [Candidatus Methylacidiphilales bacterium]NJR14796.1 TonB-dependent siderophore receptor [Calothrix sp. CSU_2_0]